MRKLLLFIRLHKTLFRVNGRPLEIRCHSSRYNRRGHWMSFYTGLPNRRLRWHRESIVDRVRAIAIAKNVPSSSFAIQNQRFSLFGERAISAASLLAVRP